MLAGRSVPVVLALYRLWRRLPAKERRRVLAAAGRHGPRLAVLLLRLRRARI